MTRKLNIILFYWLQIIIFLAYLTVKTEEVRYFLVQLKNLIYVSG